MWWEVSPLYMRGLLFIRSQRADSDCQPYADSKEPEFMTCEVLFPIELGQCGQENSDTGHKSHSSICLDLSSCLPCGTLATIARGLLGHQWRPLALNGTKCFPCRWHWKWTSNAMKASDDHKPQESTHARTAQPDPSRISDSESVTIMKGVCAAECWNNLLCCIG